MPSANVDKPEKMGGSSSQAQSWTQHLTRLAPGGVFGAFSSRISSDSEAFPLCSPLGEGEEGEASCISESEVAFEASRTA